jgi:hypothetical protein
MIFKIDKAVNWIDKIRWGLLVATVVVASLFYAGVPAYADTSNSFPYELGASTTEGVTTGQGGFTLNEVVMEAKDGAKLYSLLPFMVHEVDIFDSSLNTTLHMTEIFYNLGPIQDSYTISALNVDYTNMKPFWFNKDGVGITDGNFTGIGAGWYKEFHKGDMVMVGIYGNGDSNYLGKVEANVSVYEGDNYRLHGVVFYDNKSWHGFGELKHPVTENSYLALGYYNGVWGVGAGVTF